MRMVRTSGLCLLAAATFFAPVWAQDTQQLPPLLPAPAGRMRPEPNLMYQTGPGGESRVTVVRRRGVMGPGCGMMAGRLMGRDGGGVYPRFRDRAGLRGTGFGAGLGPGWGLERILNNPNLRRQLDITDAQAAKIRQQTEDFQVAQIRSRAELQVDEVQLRDLLAAPNPDRTAINQKLDQIGAAQLAARKQRVNYMLVMRDALTPEQRQKLQQLRQAPVRRSARGPAKPPRPAPSATPPAP